MNEICWISNYLERRPKADITWTRGKNEGSKRKNFWKNPDRHEKKELELKDAPGKLHAIEGDVSSEESILSVFKWVKGNLGGVDILINCAGLATDAPPSCGKTEDWKRLLDVNVLGLSICTREAVQDMMARGVDDGFIIHINSVVSHIPAFDDVYAMYSASKHAVKVLLDGLRLDLINRKSGIRVGQISPGIVNTDIFDNMTKISKEAALAMAHLQPEDVAAAVLYMLAQQPRVQVYDIVLRPVGSAF